MTRPLPHLSRARDRSVLLAVLLALAGCAPPVEFPAFPDDGTPADYPALQPIDALLAQADALSAAP